MPTTVAVTAAAPTFRHEALLYAGTAEFVDRTAAFVREGVEAGEPMLVVLVPEKIEALRDELGAAADGVRFADMLEVGRNPARIIAAWHEFVAEHPTGPLRGIGEPMHTGRGVEELAECETHEALLNLALADAAGMWLLCPYDVDALGEAGVAAATRTHPSLVRDGATIESAGYDPRRATSPFERPLPPPGVAVDELEFGANGLAHVRRFVARHAVAAGLSELRVVDVRMAVNELATNSLRHGGGGGLVRAWREPAALVFEVADSGRMTNPLVGRRRPAHDQEGGWGVWLANQVCDLVQIHAAATGTTIRVRVSLP